MTRATLPAVSETALLFAAPPWPLAAGSPLDAHTPFDPLLGKSLLQRAVEHLVRQGARHLLVVLGDDASAVRDFLGGGERWGCHVSYHYPDPRAPLRRFLQAIGITTLQHYRVGNAWCLPPAADSGATGRGAGVTLHWQGPGATPWTGWGCLSGAWLLSRELPADPAAIAASIAGDEWLEKQVIAPDLVADTPANLLAGMERLLDAEAATAQLPPGTRIHPGARLVGPCYIGRDVKIDAGAVIGPHAAIEDGAYVAAGASVVRSIVTAETYVGVELDLHRAIARGPVLVNAALGSRTDIADPELLAYLHPAPRQAAWSSRILAAVLQALLFPLYLLLARRRPADTSGFAVLPCPGRNGGRLESMRAALDLPPRATPGTPYDWVLHFVATFYPGLAAVRRGELRLIGPSLKSWREAARLPDEWRRIHEECPCGLLNEGWLHPVPASGGDEAFAGDALAAAGPESPRQAAGAVLAYLRNLWRDLVAGGASRPGPSASPNAV